jgi:hypothetical protein
LTDPLYPEWPSPTYTSTLPEIPDDAVPEAIFTPPELAVVRAVPVLKVIEPVPVELAASVLAVTSFMSPP